MPELEEMTDQELEDRALEGTTFEQDELEYDRAALNVPSPLEEGEISEPINRYNIINEQGFTTRAFNYIYGSPTGGWQQTDDSYRPRRLTYPENTSTPITSRDELPEENYSRQIVAQFYDSMEDANGRSARV